MLLDIINRSEISGFNAIESEIVGRESLSQLVKGLVSSDQVALILLMNIARALFDVTPFTFLVDEFRRAGRRHTQNNV